MDTQQQKTNKATNDTAKKPKTPVPAGQAVLQTESLAMNADLGTLQRSVALAGGNGRNHTIPRIQRAHGNQAAQRMISRAVRQSGRSDGSRRKVGKSGPSGQEGVIQRDGDDLGGMEVGLGIESAIESKGGSG